jgi:hypothetical protein
MTITKEPRPPMIIQEDEGFEGLQVPVKVTKLNLPIFSFSLLFQIMLRNSYKDSKFMGRVTWITERRHGQERS